MARKTDGTSTPRKKKASPSTEAAAIQPAPATAAPEVRSADAHNTEIRSSEVRSNVTPINLATKSALKKAAHVDGANMDEEIRRRAYELFLERNGAPGDPAADWIIAEREVRARYASKDSAFAASQSS